MLNTTLLGSTQIKPPAGGFDWIPLGLSRSGNTISTTFNITSLRPTGGLKTYYVQATRPNNSGAGTTSDYSDALRDLSAALLKSDWDVIEIDETAGPYYGTLGWRGSAVTRGGLIKTRFGGKAKIYNSRNTTPQTWTLHSGSIYKTNSPAMTNTSSCAIDLGVLDAYGYARVDTAVADLASLNAAGKFFFDNVASPKVAYYWAGDSRNLIGDTNVIISDTSNNGNWAPTTAALLYCENLQFVGGARAFRATNTTFGVRATLCFNNCDFWGCLNSNLFAIQGGFDVYTQDCTASGGNQDGMNYHGDSTGKASVRALELRLNVGRNGYDTGGTNNASTSHEDCRVISINSTYQTSQNRVIHDINNARRWMLGCSIGNSLDTDPAGATTLRADDNVLTWIDTCSFPGGHNLNAAADVLSLGASKIKYSNTDVSALTLSGNISRYVGL